MAEYYFTKSINSDKLKIEIASASLPAPQAIGTVETAVTITYSSALTTEQETSLGNVVAAHVAQTTSEGLALYLDGTVFPFVKDLIRDFAAENISMGITQAGKTGPLLGMFAKQYDINSDGRPYSLKDTFDTGSLYESRRILQHLRDNPTEFNGLSPYVTDARLLAMKNKIETLLGLPLST